MNACVARPTPVSALEGTDPQDIQRLIDRDPTGENLRRMDLGQTILHRAVRDGKLASVDMLVQRDPSLLQLTNHVGGRPLDVAANSRDPRIFRYLVQVHERMGWGETAAGILTDYSEQFQRQDRDLREWLGVPGHQSLKSFAQQDARLFAQVVIPGELFQVEAEAAEHTQKLLPLAQSVRDAVFERIFGAAEVFDHIAGFVSHVQSVDHPLATVDSLKKDGPVSRERTVSGILQARQAQQGQAAVTQHADAALGTMLGAVLQRRAASEDTTRGAA